MDELNEQTQKAIRITKAKLQTLETSRERKFVEYVNKKGFDALKLTKRSYPDRLILLDCGYSFMIEFKRDASKFTRRKGEKLQKHTHDKLRERGIHVYLCDTVVQAKIIFSYERNMYRLGGLGFRPYIGY